MTRAVADNTAIRESTVGSKIIWLLIQDNSLPEHGSHNRHFYFAKYLARAGYRPVVFVASRARCSNEQMIQDRSPYLVDDSHGFPWVYLRTNDYGDSMKKRLVAIWQYHRGLGKRADEFVRAFGRPDVILGSSAYPLTPWLAIKLAKRYGCKSICEVRDLWPLSLEVYGIIKRGGLLACAMYRFERGLYERSDAVVFTMEGGPDYIADKGWDIGHGGIIDLSKCHYINNGVDLEEFDSNAGTSSFEHAALAHDGRTKLVYAGSVRKANGVGFLVDVAECLRDDPVDFIVIGDGEERLQLESDAHMRGLTNLSFIGRVGKAFVPSALSQASMMMMMYSRLQQDLSKYGMSQNKLFEYLASGKSVISNLPSRYSVVNGADCGIEREFESAEDCADAIRRMLADPDSLRRWGGNARRAAHDYDYQNLACRLIAVIEGVPTSICMPASKQRRACAVEKATA